MPQMLLVLALSLSSFFIGSTNIATPENSSTCIIEFTGLECITSEGFISPDAIYFKIDGTIWPDSRIKMTPGDYRDLQGYVSHEFEYSVSIELWDDDTWDSDDFLGENTVECRSNRDGVVRFQEDGASYKLYYTVR